MAPDNGKNDDPAKMTYSIPDFVSRNATNTQEFFQYLEKKSPITKINTYRGGVVHPGVASDVSLSY